MMSTNILLVVLVNIWCVVAIDLQVTTQSGDVLGALTTSGTNTVWHLPYAAPPTGENRWKSPQAISWNSTFDATALPPLCPQAGVFTLEYNVSEDCLYLSVYVPVNLSITDAPLPVQVFIHGGSFTTGGAAIYSGEILSGTDVIFVSINYRLGVLGYLAHSSLINSADHSDGVGFYGIQDQRAALQWVKSNIAAFGGDPTRVTLSGESAGAISICVHLVAPRSAGLFQQVISESGACSITSNADALSSGLSVVSAVGCDNATDAESLTCLFGVSWSTLVGAQGKSGPSLFSELTSQPKDILLSGGGSRLPLLAGTNLNESTLFVCPDPAYNSLNASSYAALVSSEFPTFSNQLLAAYPTTSYATPTGAWADLVSDETFKCDTKILSNVLSNSCSPVYLYSLTHPPAYFQSPYITSVLFGVSDPTCLGTAHSFDLAYLFPVFESVFGVSLTSDEAVLRSTMRNAWASFVKNGVPDLPSFPWPLYDATNSAYVNLDINLTVGTNFRQSYCNIWNGPIPTTTTPTLPSQ